MLNAAFRKEKVEEIAKTRIAICESNKCGSYDTAGAGCMIPGTQPCCDERTGGCGCSLEFKIRSLSSSCPKGFWEAVLTEEEENKLNQNSQDVS